MSLFDEARDRLTDTARAAVRASREFAEVSRINQEIRTEENKIKNQLMEIGQAVYNTYRNTSPVEENLSDRCEEIREAENRIDELKAQVQRIRSTKECVQCGCKLEQGQLFCPKCGTRVE